MDKKKIMIHPRWIARSWAYIRGYFWLPCAVCDEMFGGHEWGPATWRDRAVCSKKACIKYASGPTK